jgi:hypothetical protein
MKGLKHPATVIAVVALFVALAGGAAAYASGLISGSQIKNHSIAAKKLTKAAIKSLRGQRGPTGAAGATGAAGPAGTNGTNGTDGAPGRPGFVSVGGWGGKIVVIPVASGWVFAGPTTTLTTTASQSIVASGSEALGTSGPTVLALVALCVSPTGANTPATLDPANGGNVEAIQVTSNTLTYAVSETGAPGAGTWDVGMCVKNTSPNPIDHPDFSIGWAFVANGTPVS